MKPKVMAIAPERRTAALSASPTEPVPVSSHSGDGQLSQDVDLSAIMRRENIAAIKTWPAGYFSVELNDGWFGTGKSVGAALAKAKLRAENIKRAA